MKIALALVLGVVLVIGAGCLYARDLVRSDAFRAAVEQRIEVETGARVSVHELDLSFLPPALELGRHELVLAERARYVGASGQIPISLLQLLSAEPGVERGRSNGELWIGGDSVAVSGEAALAVELSLERRGDVWHAEVTGSDASGGTFIGSGEQAPSGLRQARITLDSLDIAHFRGLLRAAPEELDALTGSFDGTLEWSDNRASEQTLHGEISSPKAVVRSNQVTLEGPVELQADVTWAAGTPDGTFTLDAKGAQLAYTAGLSVGIGSDVHLSGRIVPREGGGIGVAEVRLSLSGFSAKGFFR